MKRVSRVLLSLVLFAVLLVPPAEAATTRVIVRVNGGLPVIQLICKLLGCNVNYGLGDPDGQVFLVTTGSLLPNLFISSLRLQLGVLSVEVDSVGRVLAATGSTVPAALYD